MLTIDPINKFLAADKIAIAGVSRNKKKFGRVVFDEMKKKGYLVIPINPSLDSLDGEICYKDIASLPEDVKHLYIVTPKKQTLQVVEEAKKKNINHIWIQQMSETKEVIEYGNQNQMNMITGECIMMFAIQTGIHKFHYRLKKFFGGIPKN